MKEMPTLVEQLDKLLNKRTFLVTSKQRSEVAEKVLTDLKKSFLNCTVLTYGLNEIGINNDTTDLYLSIDTKGKVDVNTDGNLHGNVVVDSTSHSATAQSIASILRKNAYQDLSVTPLTVYTNTSFGSFMPSPLPEISCKYVATGYNVKCKIRLENYFSVQKSKLLQFYSSVDLRVPPILQLLRLWGKKFGALKSADSLDFENYSLSLLLIYFLTERKLIEPLHKLQSEIDKSTTKSLVVNQIDLSFSNNVCQIDNSSSLNLALQDPECRTLSTISLLKEFFSFCSTFNFEHNVVCPYTGETFSRELFNPKTELNTVPKSIASAYLLDSDGKQRTEKLYLFGPICVMDIFELSSNVTRAVSTSELQKFRSDCEKTVQKLEQALVAHFAGGSAEDSVTLNSIFSDTDKS